jgi:EAL domain-containing protein (putative c-di-GMP-specific phosphodiesterase class I)
LAIEKGIQRAGTDGLVYFLELGPSGQMWVGTEQGVDMWDGSRWSHYDMSDGLAWNDCNLNAFAKEPDGTIWIGTSGGLSRFKPRPRPVPEAPLKVVFTKLVMGRIDVSGLSNPSSGIPANSLIARYSALNGPRGNGVLFRYQLQGTGSAWTETRQRELQFAELAPGAYRLEIEAQDDDNGTWGRNKAEFAFRILTPCIRRGGRTKKGARTSTVDQPYSLAGREWRSSSSVGITVFGDSGASTNEVLQQADIAMYQAKAAGRNSLRFFAPALQAAVNARAALEEDLRQAIKTNDFLLYYQPQVDRGNLVGAEALLRWKHPQRGFLSPGEFIPLAEETGLILPLGNWVLDAACKQIAAWAHRKDAAHITIAVNISARQLRDPDFVKNVLTTLDRTGADPKNLKLELTESMFVDDVEAVIAKMKELKSHGLTFSLDDFGTGYSSLAYLRRLPLDQLKIDQAFVRDILVDASSGAIAQSIISLSRAMGLSVIAEGVETEAQREFLAQLGCHLYQGYLFSRPVPSAEFELLFPHLAANAAHQ